MRKFIPLQTKFVFCYLGGILIPILILSCVIYYGEHKRIEDNYYEETSNSVISEKNYLETHFAESYSYFNQLKSNYAFMQIVKGSEMYPKGIVYAYNSQIYSTLNSLIAFNENLNNITVYTENSTAAEILRYFEPLHELIISEEEQHLLYQGLWKVDNDGNYSFYVGFSNPPMTKFPGILRLTYNSSFFDAYAEGYPNDSIYVYMQGSLLYSYHGTEINNKQAQECINDDTLWENESSFLIRNKQNHCLMCCIDIEGSPFRVIRFLEEPKLAYSYQTVFINIAIVFLILCCASLLTFFLIYRPMKNIIMLSKHMNSQNSPTLTPFYGTVSNDETGSLICSFNDMVTRINELSENLLHNELQLRNAQIEALQTQLNPHFFYGTLESIRMIAEANGQELISDITFSFGNLMRYSLSREYLAPVSKEVEVTRQYISIQEKRLINRFSTEWNICEFDNKWKCPKFILFGMVENVFSHNVSKCRDFIRIDITIECSGNDMIFTVTNSGPGISPERLDQIRYLLDHPKERDSLQSESNGRSIFNIHDRLKLFYGENYSFFIDSQPGKTTTCRVRINRTISGIL